MNLALESSAVPNVQNPTAKLGSDRLSLLITIMLFAVTLGITGHFLIDAFCAPPATVDSSACTTSNLLGKGAVAIFGLHFDVAQPTWFPANIIVTLTTLMLLIVIPSVSRSLPPLVPPPILQNAKR